MKKSFFIPFAITIAAFVGCDKTDPAPVAPLTFEKPAGWPDPVYDFSKNPVSDAKFELGRKLFYSPLLSRDGTISCGSCHQQFVAFAHAGHNVSHGIDDKTGIRNSPTIFNLAWSPAFFWDGGVFDLNLQPVAPIQNPVEMDEKMPIALEKLRKTTDFPPLFSKAFGDTAITTDRFLKSIGLFMAMMTSSNSRYDQFVSGKTDALSADEQAGMAVFRQKCATCHPEPLFTDYSFRNNGLQQSPLDSGRYRVTLQLADAFKFKVPSLRNVEKSAPYMHHGARKTLEEVIDHYRSSVKDSPTLDPALKGGIAISDDEKTKLIAFLKSLTDAEFLTDPRFSEQ